MLYMQSHAQFSEEEFKNPGPDYRGAPFWAWNTLMTKEMIEKQILEFKKMGMGGFHIHVRVGLRNRYLSDEFMELIRFCNEKAKENGMLCWLYDEDRYSSGIAGGIVTRNISYRARWLKLTVNEDSEMLDSSEEFYRRQARNENVHGCFLQAYDIVLENGYLKKASVVDRNAEAEGVKWYLYLELEKESPWCNNQTYVDTLKAEAIREFIHVTHDRYSSAVGKDFGISVPAIFTDEPHINGLHLPDRAEGQEDICIPFTEALPEAFGTVDGRSFFDSVPFLIWNRSGEAACPERYRYYLTLGKLFSESYCGQIGDWCEKHNLLSTGHILGEESLKVEASMVCDPMQCYRRFQLPGMDNLCDNRDFSAAKQVASIAHQYGKAGAMSEMYGVTQWDFDFKGYKLAGDWQAALGITARVPHLAWASMNGEAKRDYPAAIGWQSPWYREFPYIENHFARLNYCMTRGKAVVHVGVIHTIESFWLLQGPMNQSEDAKLQLEDDFQRLTECLLTGGIDFDYVAESSIADEEQTHCDGKFRCGAMEYDVILVPSCINLRGSTLQNLKKFRDNGGTLIFVGQVPCYADCKRSDELECLVDSSECISSAGYGLLERLQFCREVEFLSNGKKRTINLLHQLRDDGAMRWLFISQAYNDMRARQDEPWYRRPRHTQQQLEIRIRGTWRVNKYDTINGNISHLKSSYLNGWTVLYEGINPEDSMLLRLEHGMDNCEACSCVPAYNAIKIKTALPEPFAYEMSEPNALVLDMFEYALDEERFNPRREILVIDNMVRERLNLPLRCEALAQPYIRASDEGRRHTLKLKAVFESNTALQGCFLALEEAVFCKCSLNGHEIDMTPCGYYVDEALTKVKLPDIEIGTNELLITMEYGDSSNPERMYILGDFGVEIRGAHTLITEKPECIRWGDYTVQGFPFYTGNMIYHVSIPDSFISGNNSLEVPYYAGTAVKAAVNDGDEHMLAFLPHRFVIDNMAEKGNMVKLTCFGNRYNGFGQLHMIGDDYVWVGIDSWRTEGEAWTDTYRVKPMGILTAPLIL